MFLARVTFETLGYEAKQLLLSAEQAIKAMLHDAIFLATGLATNVARPVARKITRVTPQQNVALRVARKVEISSTFRNVARRVAACDMSIATCHAIL